MTLQQTNGGKDEPNIVFMQRNGHHNTEEILWSEECKNVNFLVIDI
jgi:hypothetical protein